MPYKPGVQLDAIVAAAIPEGTDGFTADPNHPEVTATNIWRLWWQLWGIPDPSRRVYCGLTLPSYSTVRNLATKAADALEVSYTETDSPADICNAIAAAYPLS